MKDPRFSRSPARAGDRPPPWYQIGPVMALATAGTETASADTGQAEAATSADVYVYDTIGGWWGMTADDFVRDVASLDVDQLVLHLNTPGGDAMEGVAIANVLRAHRARVVVRVDGLAASAGSVIAMAGDEIVMGIGSELMLHDAWGWTVGNAAEITAYVRRLDATSNSIASTYAARTSGAAADWREAMRAEAWYTAEEAVAAGLADRVAAADETGTAEGEQVTPGGSGGFWDMWDTLRSPGRFDLSVFTYAGRAHAPAPAMPARTTPAAPAGGSIPQEGTAVDFTDEQLADMRQALDLADDADPNAITTALVDRITAPAPEPTPASSLPEGVVAIDAAQLEALQAAARRGDEARARQERDDRESLVSAAIDDGRIAPARRDHWLAQLEADAGAKDVLASLAPGLIPVGAPMGHAGGADVVDPLYESVFGKDS